MSEGNDQEDSSNQETGCNENDAENQQQHNEHNINNNNDNNNNNSFQNDRETEATTATGQEAETESHETYGHRDEDLDRRDESHRNENSGENGGGGRGEEVEEKEEEKKVTVMNNEELTTSSEKPTTTTTTTQKNSIAPKRRSSSSATEKQDEFENKDSGYDPDSKKQNNNHINTNGSHEEPEDSVFKESSSVIIEPRRPSISSSTSKNVTSSLSVTSPAPSYANTNGSVTDKELKDSLDFLRKTPDLDRFNSDFLSSLMDSYLDKDFVNRQPTLKKPVSRSPSAPDPTSRPVSRSSSVTSTTTVTPNPNRKVSRSNSTTGKDKDIERMEDLERNLRTIREKNKKQPPPPVRNKPPSVSKAWEDPREQQRLKVKEKQWPPKEPPKDVGAYVVESYGRTDPYTKKLIKDVQRNKREEEERKEAEKRATIISENTAPVKTLRDTFSSSPQKSALGALKPQTALHSEKSWIRHEKQPLVYEEAPEEPDWMQLIRTRRWKSTVKARFPCKSTDRTDFERRSTTPKNWKRLAKDKNALKMLSEIVGIGAEGEELFMRLASQREKLEDEKENMDRLAEQELMAYQVARESLGEEAAYSIEMDNPLPAARMKQIPVAATRTASTYDGSDNITGISNDALAGYPFTTSQLEAAYLTNQLLRLHPEEFRKLISLERSRQATLRWQFSSDPFDSVHEHQNLPYEMAMLASDEPRVLNAMRKIIAQGGNDDYRSVFSSASAMATPRTRSRARSEGGGFYYESDGYESSNSVSSSSSVGVVPRGRSRKKKAPVPLPKKPSSRGRSVSPSMINHLPVAAKPRRISGSSSLTKSPSMRSVHTLNDENVIEQSHSLFDDADLQLGDEIEELDNMTKKLSKVVDIDEELKGITSTLEERKKGFFEDAIRNETKARSRRGSVSDGIDPTEISSRRREFVEKDLKNGEKAGAGEGNNSTSDLHGDLPKTRHKVRRINSNAQLNAVFGGRRQMSEVEAVEGDQQQEQQNGGEKDGPQTKEELANVLSDIQNHYGTS